MGMFKRNLAVVENAESDPDKERRFRLLAAWKDQLKKKAEAELAVMERADAEELAEVKAGWRPNLLVIHHPGGDWLVYDTLDVCLNAVASIELTNKPAAPHMQFFMRYVPADIAGDTTGWFVPREWIESPQVQLANLRVNIIGNADQHISLSRHKAALVLEELIYAWKHREVKP